MVLRTWLLARPMLTPAEAGTSRKVATRPPLLSMTTKRHDGSVTASRSKFVNIKQPPIQVLQAFINLRVSTDFETIQEWLRQCRKTARDELETHTEDDKFSRIQGRSQTLKAILETSEKAPELLEQQQTRMVKNESRKRTARSGSEAGRSSR